MWQHIRSRQLLGFKFRRQQVIGSYIADFLSVEAKLIIELDGGQHQLQKDYDRKRTAYFETWGYRVLRFWNNEVIDDIEVVLESIRLALIEIPSP